MTTTTHRLNYAQIIDFFKANDAHLGHILISDNPRTLTISQAPLNLMHFTGSFLNESTNGIAKIFSTLDRDGVILIDSQLEFPNQKIEQLNTVGFNVQVFEFDDENKGEPS